VAKKFPDEEVRLLYIGRLSPYRSPPSKLLEIARGVARRVRRRVRLTVVSKTALKKGLLRYSGSDVTLEFINDRIDDNEKCKLYRESHFFIYLARGNVAMNPPITLLESVYHGAIPIVSSWVLNDIEVPLDLVADSVEEAIDRITSLWNDPERIDKVTGHLQKSFRRFYDVSRFVEAIRRTL
jgi:glycosyltransferase involved in cell wall biosynthesis